MVALVDDIAATALQSMVKMLALSCHSDLIPGGGRGTTYKCHARSCNDDDKVRNPNHIFILYILFNCSGSLEARQ